MMKPKRVSFTLVTQAADNIAASQTPGEAVDVTLDGALASGGVIPDLGMGYILSITSAANISNRTFTVTGYDQDNKAQTETITGPNATTVVSTKFWRQVTTIAISGAAAGAITIGTANTTLSAASPTYCLDIYTPDTSVAVDVTGTINYDVKKCYDRPTAGETPNWEAGGLATQTADNSTSYSAPVGAVRLQVNSYTNGATVTLKINQAIHYG